MTQTPKRRVCEVHQEGAYHVCLFPGCSQHFLCFQCARDHPQGHSTQVKEIQVLSANEVWINENEVHQKMITDQMKELIEEKKKRLTESEEMIKNSIQLAIAILERKVQIWIQELSEFKIFENHEKTLKYFSELENCYLEAKGVNFRDGDFYEQVENYQNFQDMIEKEAQPAIEKAKETMKLWQTWKDNFKRKSDAFVESIQNSEIKNIFRELEMNTNRLELEQEENEQRRSLGIQTDFDVVKGEEEEEEEKEEELLRKIDVLKQSRRNLESCILGFGDISNIVKGQHYIYISEWIPKPHPSKILELKLLYQATKDGFHQTYLDTKCGDHKPLICLIKSQGYGRVFGGYTSKGWKADMISTSVKFIEDKEAFLFSLSHFEKYPCRQSQSALCRVANYIMCFGNDIAIRNSANQVNTNSTDFPTRYKCEKFEDSQVSGAKSYLAGAENFLVEEIEVFKVIWK